VVAFARVLGTIGRQVAKLQDTMMWVNRPTSPRRANVHDAAELQTASTA
jgi:hypothetical protein